MDYQNRADLAYNILDRKDLSYSQKLLLIFKLETGITEPENEELIEYLSYVLEKKLYNQKNKKRTRKSSITKIVNYIHNIEQNEISFPIKGEEFDLEIKRCPCCNGLQID